MIIIPVSFVQASMDNVAPLRADWTAEKLDALAVCVSNRYSNKRIAQELGFTEDQVHSKKQYMAKQAEVGEYMNETECRDAVLVITA